jgi:hypothetical protein
MYTHALRVNTHSAPHIRCATGSCTTYRRFPSSAQIRPRSGTVVPLQSSIVFVYEGQGLRSTRVVGKADILPWRAAPSTLILAGNNNRCIALCRRGRSGRFLVGAAWVACFPSCLIPSRTRDCAGGYRLGLHPHGGFLVRESSCLLYFVVILLVRLLLTRVFFAGLKSSSYSLSLKMGH